MARVKSVVMTPAERRSATAAVKYEIKVVTGLIKEEDKKAKEAQKAFDAATKAITKAKASAEKDLAKLEGKLASLVPATVAA